ncbi:MAG: hypothetical protein J6A15_02555 [Clostridia bacterium]|nr:hypothetical protein [Clostridia bacterium]
MKNEHDEDYYKSDEFFMSEEFDKLLETKYADVKVPDGLFDLDEIFRKGDAIKKRRKIIKYSISAAAVFLIVIISITLIAIGINKDNEVKQQSERETYEENMTSFVKEVEVKGDEFYYGGKYKKNKVYSIKQIEIVEYSTYHENDISYPITKVKAKVENVFEGEELTEITFWVPGGIWTVSELKNSDFEYNSEEIKSLDDDDKIYVKYYEQYKIAKPEEDKVYFITLVEEDNEYYVEKNSKYGFKEYDPAINSIMNSDGKWEKIDIEEYLK